MRFDKPQGFSGLQLVHKFIVNQADITVISSTALHIVFNYSLRLDKLVI